MTVRVRECRPQDEREWERFVQHCPGATFFHRFGWQRVLREAFGHRTHYLLAETGDGGIVGILPLARVRSHLFGDKLASLPFCVYGGPATESDTARQALTEAACHLATELSVDVLEWRNLSPSGQDWPVRDLYYTFHKAIDRDHDANLKAIPNKQRAMVRKGIKAGLVSEPVPDTRRFYRVYAESVRNLGTPVFARRYLELLQREFGEDCRVLMILEQGEDVAGVLSFYFRDQVLPYYGGSIGRARAIKGCNDFMYWELMRRSADEGIRVFDFGRSKRETGAYQFKRNWGFEARPLFYEYFLVGARRVPDVTPVNPRYRLFVQAWQRLPLPIANLMGPPLARSLG